MLFYTKIRFEKCDVLLQVRVLQAGFSSCDMETSAKFVAQMKMKHKSVEECLTFLQPVLISKRQRLPTVDVSSLLVVYFAIQTVKFFL